MDKGGTRTQLGPLGSWRDWEGSSFFGQSIIIFLVRASRSPARPSSLPSRVATVSDSAATPVIVSLKRHNLYSWTWGPEMAREAARHELVTS